MNVKKVDHVGIAVQSLEKALPFYVDVLQLKFLGMEEVESEKVKVAFLKAGETKIELLEPTSPESAIAKFIEKRGEGIHHVKNGSMS
jgi:methylmalonyl-CoA/ethylmalonyl-CoA epimerase